MVSVLVNAIVHVCLVFFFYQLRRHEYFLFSLSQSLFPPLPASCFTTVHLLVLTQVSELVSTIDAIQRAIAACGVVAASRAVPLAVASEGEI